MYISKDEAGRLYADTMAKVDIAIAYGVELFYKTLIESISKDDKMDEVTE